ncbi:Uncharacterized conserved protein [Salinimicrobium catena]|uniref:Uncharacterized conserved protein n=1 Tax=Salinimicrobium catena TaxID=390640 RepID=A0A1H5N490_9FLAO|nr:DNA/RNA helicase domain-containing protein [Salinimicrobium catena]SDL36558.1 Uncharacterized conserved protein [Salinimicrobium catena]SEE96402.1 Uncharacterized conserved protein [Salinimicrobium catena]
MKETAFEQTVYSINEFLSVDVATWGERLKKHHLQCMQQAANGPQRKAWFDCFNILRECFKTLEDYSPKAHLIFEYELPRERGRRPDVLMLSGNNLIVLEFKGYARESLAQVDQVKHYARDLEHYHLESRNLQVIPVLVLGQGTGIHKNIDGVEIVTGDQLCHLLLSLIKDPFVRIEKWFESEYSPLPSLVQAAQLLYKEKSFPKIKRSQSAGIPNTLKKLHQILRESKKNKDHHLALITGVPGAGKTLVGLQFVFEEYVQENDQTAVFLSGNRPLVQVLQKSLKSTHFVQDVNGFLKQYAHSKQLPKEDVIIYDEAQRAWDAERVIASHREGNNSEPVDFINIGDRKENCLLIGLIGEGQEIHLGEESGMDLWTEAISVSNNQWKIHCPEKLADHFLGSPVSTDEDFNLTTSLRTHQALTLQQWVEALLENQPEESYLLSADLFKEGYPLYVTRDLEKAKSYVKQKYEGENDKTFGLMASSKSQLLPRFGVKNDFNSTRFNPAYYVDSSSGSYCCNLNMVVTEFGCQGLELDMPIVAWEADWIYDNGWKNKGPNYKAKDPDNLKKNAIGSF